MQEPDVISWRDSFSLVDQTRVSAVRCDELGTDRPYLLITGPLTDYLSTLPEDDLVDLRNTLQDLLPQTAEFFQNLNKAMALKEAEQKLTAATKDLGEAPTLQEIGLLASLAKCLHQQNKQAESTEVFQKAEALLQDHINSIENDHYKEAILNSPIIEIFKDLRKLLQRKPFNSH